MAGVQSAAQIREPQEETAPSFVGRILFVGPHEDSAMVEALEAKGFQIICTSSVVQALTLAVAARITMVITGPGEIGESFLDGLRGLPAYSAKRDLPLIWLGHEGENEDRLLRRGVSLFLAPPYPVAHLVTAAMFTI